MGSRDCEGGGYLFEPDIFDAVEHEARVVGFELDHDGLSGCDVDVVCCDEVRLEVAKETTQTFLLVSPVKPAYARRISGRLRSLVFLFPLKVRLFV